MVAGSGITNAIQDAVDLEDSAIAKQIDTYGYGKLASASMDEAEWDPTTQQDYIDLLTGLKAKLFNKDVYGDYRLGLGATEYGRLVSALTSVLKFETLAARTPLSWPASALVRADSLWPLGPWDLQVGFLRCCPLVRPAQPPNAARCTPAGPSQMSAAVISMGGRHRPGSVPARLSGHWNLP